MLFSVADHYYVRVDGLKCYKNQDNIHSYSNLSEIKTKLNHIDGNDNMGFAIIEHHDNYTCGIKDFLLYSYEIYFISFDTFKI